MALHEVPILTPVQRICSSELVLGEKEWEHINVWGFPYNMRFDRAEVKQLLIKHERKFHRLLCAKISNLCYGAIDGKWSPANGGFWGHGCLLDVQEESDGSFSLNSLLYMKQTISFAAQKVLLREKEWVQGFLFRLSYLRCYLNQPCHLPNERTMSAYRTHSF